MAAVAREWPQPRPNSPTIRSNRIRNTTPISTTHRGSTEPYIVSFQGHCVSLREVWDLISVILILYLNRRCGSLRAFWAMFIKYLNPLIFLVFSKTLVSTVFLFIFSFKVSTSLCFGFQVRYWIYHFIPFEVLILVCKYYFLTCFIE